MGQSVVVIGNFDGVHAGHRALIERAKTHAQNHGGLPVVAVTFWPHPMSVFAPDKAPKLLCNLDERIELLKQAGVDQVRVIRFTRQIANWSPEQFVTTIIEPLRPAALVVGENFRFGKDAAGSPNTLRALADGYLVDEAALTTSGGDAVSSSIIRNALGCGDVELARENLGRNFQVRGVVVVGDQRGRLLGFPTANLAVTPEFAVPSDGVYAGWVRLIDEPCVKMAAAISVGTNPTFGGLERRVESYVLDRSDLALYGARISVEFVKKLRGVITFASVDDLVAQMAADVENTRKILGVKPCAVADDFAG